MGQAAKELAPFLPLKGFLKNDPSFSDSSSSNHISVGISGAIPSGPHSLASSSTTWYIDLAFVAICAYDG